jgi:peptidoglycan hydrolase CwlO-like protein
MLSLRPSHGSTASTDREMRLLYVSSGGSPIDSAATGQLAKTVGRRHVTEVESAAAAIAELRGTTTEYRALLISPGFNEAEALALIRGLRSEGVPVAIVPVVSEAQRGLCNSAVRAGADAVLLMVNGLLVEAQETLKRLLPRTASPVESDEPAPSRPPAAVVATQRALAELRKLHTLLYGKPRLTTTRRDDDAEHPPGESGPLGLTPPAKTREEPVSPAGAEAMADKSRSTHAPATVGGAHPRRPVLASVPTARDPRTGERPFDSRTRAALEAALQASRVELRRAADAHAAERDLWEVTRRELEARLDEGHADSRGRLQLEGALEDATRKLAAANNTFAAERTAWENTRRELEMRVKTLQAVIGSTRKIEAELRTTQAELQRVMSGEGSKESGWEDARQRLEAELESRTAELESRTNELESRAYELQARTNELETANAERARLEEGLQAAHAELQRMAAVQAEEAANWERHREQLEQQVSDLHAAGESARNESASVDARGEIDQAQRTAENAMRAAEQARSEAHELRTELETRTSSLEELRAEHARLASAYRALEGKLSEAREQVRQLGNRPAAEPAAPAPGGSAVVADLRRDGNRIEQIGKLGAAMAPEIEALVSSIDQSAARLARQLDPSNPQRAEIETILKSSGRATSLVRQLVTFSRKQARPVARVEVNDIVKRAEPALARLLGADIELRVALGPAGAITVGEHDVEQMLSVLMFSVRESLPLGGSVVISTTSLDSARLQIAATAFGYGVQAARSSSALDSVLRRCGGQLTLAGEPDRDAVVQISLPQAQAGQPAD